MSGESCAQGSSSLSCQGSAAKTMPTTGGPTAIHISNSGLITQNSSMGESTALKAMKASP